MNMSARVFGLDEWRDEDTTACINRAHARGFPMFLLCVNEEISTPSGPRAVPVVSIGHQLDRNLLEEWSSRRHAQDPIRRLHANGALDQHLIGPLLWENDDGRLSLPSARVTSSEAETLHLAYTNGVRTAVNVPVGATPGRVIASFFSDERAAQLPELEDTLAILFYLSHRIHAVLAPRLEAHRRPASGRLTRREAECLHWIAKGKNATEIATILTLSVATVRDHIKSMRAKLGASTRAQAIARAAALGQLN